MTAPPPTRRSPGSEARATSTPPSAATESNPGNVPLRRQWRRRAWLDCGHTEPCRCDYYASPTSKRIDGYVAAIELLSDLGYPAAPLAPELRALRRRGGAERRMAETIVRRWSA